MEFYIGDAIVSEEPFQKNLPAESLYLTDLDTLQTFHYGQSPVPTDYQFQMSSLENPYIMNWNGEDCYAWATRVCVSHNFNMSTVNISSFKNITGEELMAYSSYEFCALTDLNVGSTFYYEFQDMLRGRDVFLNSPVPESMTYVTDNEFQLPEVSDLTDLNLEAPLDRESIDRILADEDFGQSFGNNQNSVFQDGPLFIKTEDISNSYDEDLFREVPFSPDSQASLPSPSSSCTPPPPSSPSPTCSFTSGGNILGKIKTTSRKRERGPKNWEYLMRMLIDEEYNPSVIRWEDESAHTFRIVKPSVVAKTWGRRSKKTNLTYDNFARGLRYHYTTGALEAVSERQLVYRCGPKAVNYLNKELQYKRR